LSEGSLGLGLAIINLVIVNENSYETFAAIEREEYDGQLDYT
jgi:hypothetical protein